MMKSNNYLRRVVGSVEDAIHADGRYIRNNSTEDYTDWGFYAIKGVTALMIGSAFIYSAATSVLGQEDPSEIDMNPDSVEERSLQSSELEKMVVDKSQVLEGTDELFFE